MSKTGAAAVDALFNLIAGIDGGENNSKRQEDAYQLLRTVNNSMQLAADRESALRDKIVALEQVKLGLQQKLGAKNESAGVEVIAEERRRQLQKLGWTPEADDQWENGELAQAAKAYILATTGGDHESCWPWADYLFRQAAPIHMLAKAGALIAAEIDRRIRSGDQP